MADLRRSAPADIGFLVAVVVTVALTYLGSLGFYSDDWAFLGSLNSFGDYSNAGRSGVEEFDFSRHVWARPTQAGYQWMLFRLFGTDPFGYHVVNALVMAAMVSMLYLVLRELGAPRVSSVGAGAVLGTMPNFSTDKFWFAAFGYGLSMAACLLAVYAALRALRNPRAVSIPWKVIAVTSLVVCGLGYEVTLPIAAFGLALVWWRTRVRLRAQGTPGGGLRAAALLAPELLVLAGAVAFKALTAVQTGIPGSYLAHIVRVATGAITTNLIGWGIDLPRAFRWGWPGAGMRGLVIATVVAVAVFVYLLRLAPRDRPERVAWLPLIGAGAIVFVLGYAIFAVNARVAFTVTGIGNRVTIAASMGMALAGVGVIGWLCARKRGAFAATIFSVMVGLWAGTGTFAVVALAQQWGRAWDRQQQVLGDLSRDLPRLPPKSAVILSGVCPYEGSAIVFESNWDLAGALEVAYNDPTIKADVAGSGLRVREGAIETVLYGSHEARYPYGPNLLIYDHTARTIHSVPDAATARRVLADNPSCPGLPGQGEMILPADDLQRRIEGRLG